MKPSGNFTSLPLKLIFKSLINEGVFPSFIKDCKKINVVPIHKKELPNLIRNYKPINLLQIFRKVFERLVFNVLLNFFFQNKLFTPCQSGFITGDSCVSELRLFTR